jgi:folate-dependent phosphoribosylglycinamide formyltransferase PurN
MIGLDLLVLARLDSTETSFICSHGFCKLLGMPDLLDAGARVLLSIHPTQMFPASPAGY